LSPDLGKPGRLNVCKAKPGLLAAQVQQYITPWIDCQAVAIGCPAILMRANLSG
jgi:hypothetical protein